MYSSSGSTTGSKVVEDSSIREVNVWDPLVRVFHWGLVGSFTVAYLTEDEWMAVHSYAGYIIMGLLAFRIIWGFVGGRYARFSDFVTSPTKLKAYLKSMLQFRSRRYLGHNPAGGWMILALIGTLLLTTVSGTMMIGAEGSGPLAGTALAIEADWLEGIHEFFANSTLMLVVLHVGGVVFSSISHNENLVRAMINGRKRER